MRDLLLVLAALCFAGSTAISDVRRPVRGSSQMDETTRIINDCQSRINSFRKTLDRTLAGNSFQAGGNEEKLSRQASKLQDALGKVGDSWEKNHDLNKSRGSVRSAISIATDINKTMRKGSPGTSAENEWASIRDRLNQLAHTFGVARV